MSRDKFFCSLDKGFGFCDVVLGWDSNDQLYDNVQYTGWHTGYPDAAGARPARILPRRCPSKPSMLFFLGEFVEQRDVPCPRGLLRRVLDKARGMGFEVYAGLRVRVLRVRGDAGFRAREALPRICKPIAPGFFGYSVMRNSVHSEFYLEILDLCEKMRIPLEGLHKETGPGVLEAAIAVDQASKRRTRPRCSRPSSRSWRSATNRMATFMAKWSND